MQAIAENKPIQGVEYRNFRIADPIETAWLRPASPPNELIAAAQARASVTVSGRGPGGRPLGIVPHSLAAGCLQTPRGAERPLPIACTIRLAPSTPDAAPYDFDFRPRQKTLWQPLQRWDFPALAQPHPAYTFDVIATRTNDTSDVFLAIDNFRYNVVIPI